MKHFCDIVAEPLKLEAVLGAVTSAEVGGVSVFLGSVRNHNDGRVVSQLDYEAYRSMALSQMQAICAGIAAEIEGVRLACVHRVGSLHVGDIAVICVAGAPHRGEAFKACRALIDRIKHQVPIWKREHGPDGPYWVGWQDARCSSEAEPGQAEHEHEHEHT